MSFLNTTITSSALVIMIIGSVPMAQARITDNEDGSTAPKQILKLTATVKDGAWEIKNSQLLESHEIDATNNRTSTTSTLEADLHKPISLLTITPKIDEELKNENYTTSTKSTSTTSSTTNTTPTLEENLTALLNAFGQSVPKATNVLKEAVEKPKEEQQHILKRGFGALGQDLLNDPQVSQPLTQIVGPNVLDGWLQSLGNSSRRGDERSFNSANYGLYVKNHDLVKAALRDPQQKLLTEATTDPVLYERLMSKVVRFPGLKEKIDGLKTEREENQYAHGYYFTDLQLAAFAKTEAGTSLLQEASLIQELKNKLVAKDPTLAELIEKTAS